MSLHIANCPKCGKVFNPTFADLCPQCHKQIDREYEQCATYLREHRGATISELSEATGVSMRQITNFIRERRISITDSPNMGYPCDSCGDLIREGKLCITCHQRLSTSLSYLQQEEKLRNEPRHGAGYRFKQTDK